MDTRIIKYTSQTTERIDKFLQKELSELSRTNIQNLISEGYIKVDGKEIKTNFKLKEGNEITIEYREPEELDVVKQDIPIDIVYEDSDLIVVNKTKGMVVHPSAGHRDGTLVNALLFHSELSSINGTIRPGIVHRIDMDTTGIIIVCKNDNAHQHIAKQLAEHSITRKYVAIVSGNIKEDEGVVDAAIARSKNDRKKMTVIDDIKRAVTHFKVLERLNNYTYIECVLETGRTHQIRVHMSYLHHPLLGDEVYSNKKENTKLKGQCLHAKVLGFIHPSTNEYMEFEAPLPEYFKEILMKFRKN